MKILRCLLVLKVITHAFLLFLLFINHQRCIGWFTKHWKGPGPCPTRFWGLQKDIYVCLCTYIHIRIYTTYQYNCFRNHWWWWYWPTTYQVFTMCQALSEVFHKLFILTPWESYSQQLRLRNDWTVLRGRNGLQYTPSLVWDRAETWIHVVPYLKACVLNLCYTAFCAIVLSQSCTPPKSFCNLPIFWTYSTGLMKQWSADGSFVLLVFRM